MNYIRLRFFLNVLLVLILISSISCRTIKLVPDYDSELATQIQETSKLVDTHYLTMISGITENARRVQYFQVSESYVQVEVELRSILLKNKVRDLNEESITISQRVLDQFVTFKERHKQREDGYSAVFLEDDWMVMQDLMFLLSVSEDAKRLAKAEQEQNQEN